MGYISSDRLRRTFISYLTAALNCQSFATCAENKGLKQTISIQLMLTAYVKLGLF